MRPERRRLVIDVELAPSVRAAVGPTAWFVLEALAERCPSRCPSAEVEVSTRQLGGELNLSKDSVARTLRVLATQGLVRRTDQRDPRSGRFLASVYVVDLAAAGLAVEDGDSAGPHDPSRRAQGHLVDPVEKQVEPDRWWTQVDFLSDGPTRTY